MFYEKQFQNKINEKLFVLQDYEFILYNDVYSNC